MQQLDKLNRSALFWWSVIVLCLVLEAGALYYQYALDYLPCVLCVQVRGWVLVILLAGIAGLWLRGSRSGLVIANFLGLIAAGGMLERSYQTLATERGWTMGDCGAMDAAFPTWLPLDKWLPSVFQALEPCGVTPWLIPMRLSMAEGLVLFAAAMVLIFLLFFLRSLFSVAR